MWIASELPRDPPGTSRGSAVEQPEARQAAPSEVTLTRALMFPPTIETDSAAVGHQRHFPELPGVDGQSATMMRGVLDHGPDDVADGLAAHDRTGRKW
jgi:hypothetical protein